MPTTITIPEYNYTVFEKDFWPRFPENAIFTIATLTIAIFTISSVSKQHCPCHHQAGNGSHLRKELAKMDFQWEPLLSVGEINAVQVCA